MFRLTVSLVRSQSIIVIKSRCHSDFVKLMMIANMFYVNLKVVFDALYITNILLLLFAWCG